MAFITEFPSLEGIRLIIMNTALHGVHTNHFNALVPFGAHQMPLPEFIDEST
jgi:hypothetical protein